LEDAFTNYNETYDEKTTEAKDEDIDKFIEDLEMVNDYYIKAKSKLIGRLSRRSAAANAAINHENQSIRLPPINIPTFEGDLNDWYQSIHFNY